MGVSLRDQMREGTHPPPGGGAIDRDGRGGKGNSCVIDRTRRQRAHNEKKRDGRGNQFSIDKREVVLVLKKQKRGEGKKGKRIQDTGNYSCKKGFILPPTSVEIAYE